MTTDQDAVSNALILEAAALARYTASPTVANLRAYLYSQILRAIAQATWWNNLDRIDVSPIRSILITELRAFRAIIAPVLASAGFAAINDAIAAIVATGALTPAQLAAAQARIAAAYTACNAAFGLVSAARTAAGLPAARPLGAGTAPTTDSAAGTELAAVLAANVPVAPATAAYEAALAASY